jgi:hypothetical protein
MNRYLVTWTIDIYADSFEDAALQCLGIQRDSDSVATVFRVTDHDSGESKLLDINPVDGKFEVREIVP